MQCNIEPRCLLSKTCIAFRYSVMQLLFIFFEWLVWDSHTLSRFSNLTARLRILRNTPVLCMRREPVSQMIHYLTTYFDPEKVRKWSLEIRSGRG